MDTKNTGEMRRLGPTEIEVTPIGLGVMQFSGGKGLMGAYFRDLPQEEMNAIVRTALEGGINWFDTAEMYGRGHSERSLARALQEAEKSDEEVIVGTKWFPILRTAGNIPRTIDQRLAYLDGYSIDLYMIHQPYSFSSPEAEMAAMADLYEAGKIRSVGISNFNAERMRRAHAKLAERGLPLAVNQVQYSLLERSIESNGILETARELGVTIVAWGPLASGVLTGKFHKDPAALQSKSFIRRRTLARRLESSRPVVEALEEIAPRYEATPGQVALNWLIHFQGDIVVAIPGASSVRQAKESAEAMNFRLSDDDLARLDEVSRPFL